jgi:hypothetical protein
VRVKLILSAVAFVASAAAVLFGFWIWVVAQNNPTPYADILDEFAVPGSWELTHEEIHAPGVNACVPGLSNCPSITRFYLVDADPKDSFDTMSGLVTSAGFQVDTSREPSCNENGTSGPVTCVLAAIRGKAHLWIVFWDRGELTSYTRSQQSFTVGAPNRSVVRIAVGPQY